MGQFNLSDYEVKPSSDNGKLDLSKYEVAPEKKNPDATTNVSSTGSNPSPNTKGTELLKNLNDYIKQKNQNATGEQKLNLQKQQWTNQIQGATEKFEKEHPGDWSNFAPIVTHALTKFITKPLAGAASVTRSVSKLLPGGDYAKDSELYDKNGNLTEYGKTVNDGKTTDYLGKLITGLDSYNNETDKEDYLNPLPRTFLGNTVSGLVGLAPTVGATALFPEGEAGEALSPFAKLKQVTVNPFTKISAIQGGLDSYDKAKQKGKSDPEALLEAGKGAVTEGGQAALYNVLGEIGGNFVSPKIAKYLTENGIAENGKLTKMGADAVSDALVFSAYPIASDLIQGKQIDWNNVQSNLGMGLLFGGLKAVKTGGEFSEADQDLNQPTKDVSWQSVPNGQSTLEQLKRKLQSSDKDEVDFAKRYINNPVSYYKDLLDDAKKDKEKPEIDKYQGILNQIYKNHDQHTKQAIALNNFMDASPEAITEAHDNPHNPADLQAMAVDYADKARKETDLEKRKQLIAASSVYGKLANVKTMSQAILADKDAFIKNIEGSDLSDENKQKFIDKVNETHKNLDPLEKQKTDLGKQIADKDEQIKVFSEKSDDPVKNAENEVNLEQAKKEREDLNNQLKTIILKQKGNEKGTTQSEGGAQENGRPGQQMDERPTVDEKGEEKGSRIEQEPTEEVKTGDEKSPITEPTPNFFKLGENDEFYHASPTKRVGELRPGTAPQFGEGVYFSTNKDLVINEFGKELTKVNLSIEKPLYTNSKEESAVRQKAADNWNKENLTWDKENEEWVDKKGKTSGEYPLDGSQLGEKLPVKYFSDAAKQMGYDAIIDPNSEQYENEIVVLDTKKIHYKEEGEQENGVQEQSTGFKYEKKYRDLINDSDPNDVERLRKNLNAINMEAYLRKLEKEGTIKIDCK